MFLKVDHGVGDLASISNMQFHRLSWSHLNSFGACYFNCFGALLEAALEVGLGRSATWDLWVIYWKHGHKWNNTRTKKIKEVGKMIIDISSIFLGEKRSCLSCFLTWNKCQINATASYKSSWYQDGIQFLGITKHSSGCAKSRYRCSGICRNVVRT